jgi:hypothetical protein
MALLGNDGIFRWWDLVEGDTGPFHPPFFLALCFLATMRWSDSFAMCSHHNVLPWYRCSGPIDHELKTSKTMNQNKPFLLNRLSQVFWHSNRKLATIVYFYYFYFGVYSYSKKKNRSLWNTMPGWQQSHICIYCIYCVSRLYHFLLSLI